MSKRAALVTGVSRGIGLAIAERLTLDGHYVVGLARSKPEAFKGTFLSVDLADAAATAAALDVITRQFDVLRLVNNAGVARFTAADGDVATAYGEIMPLNVRTPLQCMAAVIPAMRAARFGRIVNIGSRASLGKAGRIVYGASKAAVTGMTRTAALELARDGITVNCIAPGPIETDMIRIGYPEGSETRTTLTGEIPIGRFGTADEIAAAAAYFLSDSAGFTTGQVLYVCGGLTAGLAPI